MGIYRSTNPLDFNAIDGIVIDDEAPPPALQGVGVGTAILVGQFARGPAAVPTPVGSTGELQALFGKSDVYSGNVALANKKFSALNIVRVVASDAAKGTKTFQDGATHNLISFTAKYKGVYGNSITVTVAAGSTAGSKYTVHDGAANAVIPDEVYDNVVITAVGSTFAGSKLVDVAVLDSTHGEPTVAAATALTGGLDGTVADTDYQTAITAQEVQGAGDILFLDAYNANRNGYIKTSVANTMDKVGILSGALSDLYTDAVTNVATKRDTDGRLIYAFNPVQTVIGGVNVYTDPASWVATILSQTAPNVDPAFAANTQFLAGVVGLQYTLTRAAHIALKNAGICAFEFDNDIGFKLKTGVTTQIADSSKVTILRRRMADYLEASAGTFLKNYQNAVNSKDNRNNVKAAILDFVGRNQRDKVLPTDKDIKSGKVTLVDTESLNTDDVVGQGYFYVLWKQRIFSSMRYIVLKAQIGETVVVTAQ